MWVFTQTGFVSVVNHDREDGKITVRARDKASLEDIAMMADARIESTPARDYEHRVYVDPSTYAEWLSHHVQTLDYSNFKSRVGAALGNEWYKTCGRVWGVMHDISDTH